MAPYKLSPDGLDSSNLLAAEESNVAQPIKVCHLFRLPIELRLQIYKCALPANKIFRHHDTPRLPRGGHILAIDL